MWRSLSNELILGQAENTKIFCKMNRAKLNFAVCHRFTLVVDADLPMLPWLVQPISHMFQADSIYYREMEAEQEKAQTEPDINKGHNTENGQNPSPLLVPISN